MIGDYELGRCLGRGGMGAVYEAVHRVSGRRVALKTLELAGETSSLRFAREGRLLQRLEHPNVCRALEFGELATGGLYLAMELLVGEDLANRLDREGPLDASRAVDLAVEVAAGLSHAHEAGVVHRDVKPSNVFLTAEGAKVLDFGLASVGAGGSDVARLTRSGHLLGTPAYMAPEQASGDHPVGPAADVYGLGALLFHAVTGAPPVGGATPYAVLARLLHEGPESLGVRRPDLPGALTGLVDAMLARNPAARPESMAVVRARLLACRAGVAEITDDETVAPSNHALHLENRVVTVVVLRGVTRADAVRRVVGRFGGEVLEEAAGCLHAVFGAVETDGDEALRAVEAARRCANFADLVTVRTQRGVGRLARREEPDSAAGLVIDAATAARLRPRADEDLPLTGRDAERADLLAHVESAFDDEEAGALMLTGPAGVGKSRLLREIARVMEERDVSVIWGQGELGRRYTGWAALANRLRALLARASEFGVPPERARVVATALGAGRGTEPALPRDPRRMRDQVVQALGDLLEAQTQHGPVLLVLDNLQWVDDPSLEFVEILLRRLAGAALFVLLAARPGAAGQRSDLMAWPQLQRRTLRDLSKRSRQRLVAIAADRAGLRLDDALRRGLAEHAGGNPLFIRETVRHVAERQQADPEADPLAMTLPATVEASLQGRLDRLGAAEKDLLKRAAVLGERFWREALPTLGCAQPGPLLARLTRLDVVRRSAQRDARLPSQEEYRFRQPALREVAYGMLTATQRVGLHRAAAGWLAAIGTARPEEVALHFSAGGQPAEASPWWARAADMAKHQGTPDLGLEYLARAVETAPAAECRAGLRIQRARLAQGYGRLQVARAEMDSIEALPVSAEQRALAWFVIAKSYQNAGDAEERREAVRLFREAAQLLEGSGEHRHLRVECLSSLAVSLLYARDPEAERVAGQALELAGDDDAGLMNALDAISLIRMHAGDLRDAHSLTSRAAECARRAGDLRLEASIQGDLGYIGAMLGRLDEAEHSLSLVLQRTRELGIEHSAGYALHNRGLVNLYRGNHDDAVADQDAAIEIAKRTGNMLLGACAKNYRTMALVAKGEGEAALVAAQKALAESEGLSLEGLARLALAGALRCAGRRQAALVELGRALALREERGMADMQAEILLLKAQLLSELGEPTAAEAWREGRVAVLRQADDLTSSPAERAMFIEGCPARRALMVGPGSG